MIYNFIRIDASALLLIEIDCDLIILFTHYPTVKGGGGVCLLII